MVFKNLLLKTVFGIAIFLSALSIQIIQTSMQMPEKFEPNVDDPELTRILDNFFLENSHINLEDVNLKSDEWHQVDQKLEYPCKFYPEESATRQILESIAQAILKSTQIPLWGKLAPKNHWHQKIKLPINKEYFLLKFLNEHKIVLPNMKNTAIILEDAIEGMREWYTRATETLWPSNKITSILPSAASILLPETYSCAMKFENYEFSSEPAPSAAFPIIHAALSQFDTTKLIISNDLSKSKTYIPAIPDKLDISAHHCATYEEKKNKLNIFTLPARERLLAANSREKETMKELDVTVQKPSFTISLARNSIITALTLSNEVGSNEVVYSTTKKGTNEHTIKLERLEAAPQNTLSWLLAKIGVFLRLCSDVPKPTHMAEWQMDESVKKVIPIDESYLVCLTTSGKLYSLCKDDLRVKQEITLTNKFADIAIDRKRNHCALIATNGNIYSIDTMKLKTAAMNFCTPPNPTTANSTSSAPKSITETDLILCAKTIIDSSTETLSKLECRERKIITWSTLNPTPGENNKPTGHTIRHFAAKPTCS